MNVRGKEALALGGTLVEILETVGAVITRKAVAELTEVALPSETWKVKVSVPVKPLLAV